MAELVAGLRQRQPELAWLRYYALFDGSACLDVLSSIEIRRCGIAATLAGETILSRTIGSGDMVAVGALLARMPWVHEDHQHTRERGLVRHILPELEESPIGLSWALLASGLNPAADTGEVFQSDSRRGALRSLHEPFGDGMVGVLLKPGLLAFKQREAPPCRPGAMLLQAFPAFGVALAFAINRLACVHRAIRVHGKVDDAEVYTQDTFYADGLGLQDITDHGKVERTLDVHQINLTLAKGQQGALTLATLVGNGHAALHRPEREHGVRAETKNSIIVGLCGITPEASARLAVQFVGICHLGNTPYRHLCGKTKLLPTALIGQLVQSELSKGVGVPGLPCQPRTRAVRHLQRLQQRIMLFRGRCQFEIRHKFHISSIEHLWHKSNRNCWPCRPTSFPPRPERRGLSEVFR